MQGLMTIPGVENGDLREGTCDLEITPLPDASTVAEAWSRLPAEGCGVVVLSDRIARFDPTRREGLLVEAEVMNDQTTTIIRMDGGVWRAWRWVEKSGTSHRYVERDFRSSEPVVDPPHLTYRHYWSLQDDDYGIKVWRPVGARFCGFQEAGR